MSLLQRTRPDYVRELRARGIEIPDHRIVVAIEERPQPARWIRLAEERRGGLARDLTERVA